MSDNDFLIWVRGWEDTFTAAGYTTEQCHQWLKRRMCEGFEKYLYDKTRGVGSLHELVDGFGV